MSKLFLKLLALTCVTASTLSWSAPPEEHASHHPAAAPTKPAAKTASKAASVPKATAVQMTTMEPQMKAMREMHEKMMNATTPEERSALMADHMKAMQDGMTMMKGMSGMGMGGMGDVQGQSGMPGDMGKHHQMMEQRMEMMRMTMEMMMDRLPAPPATPSSK